MSKNKTNNTEMKEKKGWTKIPDEALDNVAGGYVVENKLGNYDIIDDKTGEVLRGNYESADAARTDAFLMYGVSVEKPPTEKKVGH